MSLFGDSTTETTPRRTKTASSLFDDTAVTPTRNSGLFAEDANNNSDSPWGFSSSKRAARSTLVKTLLPGNDVPEVYVDIFDKLLTETGGSQSGVKVEAVKKVLQDSGVDEDASGVIMRTVMPDETKEIGRGEVNVLLALIGLAQEGDEITLDGVDERRRNLPIPNLGAYTSKKEEEPTKETLISPAAPSAPAPETPTISRQNTTAQPTSPTRQRSTQRQSFGFPDSDPWGTPELHRGHSHTSANGTRPSSKPAPAVAPERTTSAFTTTSQSASDVPTSPPTRQSSSGAGLWSGYNNPTGGSFRESGLGDGFGETPGGDGDGGNNTDPTGLGASFVAPRLAPSGPEEVITVTSLPEKEGMFMFQHRNYQVTSARRNSKVIRRYSDFAWLLDCLHRRYPFRQLPLLPPKRVAINGNYIAADASFVEKRRRGLARFANALVRHPVLSQEQLVIMFLTVPTELAVWRKQAAITIQEEFTNKSLPSTLEDSLPPNLQTLFDRVRTGVRRSAEQYINLCNSMERMVKRNEGVAAEYLRIGGSLRTLTDVSADTYAADQGDMLALNMGITAASRHFESSRALLEDEARAWDEGVLEDLKRQRDALVSMRDMFDRRDRLDRDNIPQLERRIKNNEERLIAIRSKPEGTIKPGEAEKVEDAILKDKQSIVDQHARGVFIKECLKDEIAYFQSSQFQISRLHQDWAAERVKYAELQADNWRALAEEVESMPLGE